jgi:hypothetical protein
MTESSPGLMLGAMMGTSLIIKDSQDLLLIRHKSLQIMNAFHDTVAFFRDADRVINCMIQWKF